MDKGDNGGPKPRPRTSLYRRDFLGKLEILRVRVRFKKECRKQKRTIPETNEQLDWLLQEFDRIQAHYEKQLPWPTGSLGWVLKESWPKESDLMEDLLRLEKDYYAQITKPPR